MEEGQWAGCLAVKSLLGAPLNVNWILIDEKIHLFISFWIKIDEHFKSAAWPFHFFFFF